MHAHTDLPTHTHMYTKAYTVQPSELVHEDYSSLAIITVAIHNIAAEAVATATELHPDIGSVYVITCRKNEYLTAPATSQAHTFAE